MKQLICLTLLFFGNQLLAQDASTIFTKNGIPLEVRNTPNNILVELNKEDSILGYNIAAASFPATKKLDWHYHPGGQVLIITDGIGYYQERGKPKQVVKKGEVIRCLPNVEHWHGASEETGVTYIAVYSTKNGVTVWQKPVTDEEYKSIAAKYLVPQTDQEIIQLSKQKWQWMSDKNANELDKLFDAKSMFVHMGGTWGKEQEMNVIKSGNIWYKQAEVYDVSVKLFGNTAILLNDIDLVAVVGGNEVTNAFMVTEVYVKEGGQWKMGQLTFSKLARPVKLVK